jgi:hypothetical protein
LQPDRTHSESPSFAGNAGAALPNNHVHYAKRLAPNSNFLKFYCRIPIDLKPFPDIRG